MLKELQQSTKRIVLDSCSDTLMWAHTVATVVNNNILLVAFAQGLPSLLWFISIASICKQTRRLQATGAAPRVQCYLLSQPRRGAPPAGSCSHCAHAWFSYLYLSAHGYSVAAAAWEGDSYNRTATFCHRLSHLYCVISCCLTNDWKLQAIMLSVEQQWISFMSTVFAKI